MMSCCVKICPGPNTFSDRRWSLRAERKEKKNLEVWLLKEERNSESVKGEGNLEIKKL